MLNILYAFLTFQWWEQRLIGTKKRKHPLEVLGAGGDSPSAVLNWMGVLGKLSTSVLFPYQGVA